jgi:transcriptional regulator with XRE-family HTH domain
MDGTTLAQRRKALGLTMAELATEAGISHVTVWRLEKSGKRPTLVVERAIEEALTRLEQSAVANDQTSG